MSFLRPAKQELIVKTEDIVPNNNIGIFALDERSPSQQDFAFSGDAVAPYDGDGLDDGAFNGCASVEDDTMI
jgi:hypothetical protein